MDDGDVEIDGDSEGRDVGHCDADGTIDGADDGSVDNDGCVEIEGASDGRLVLDTFTFEETSVRIELNQRPRWTVMPRSLTSPASLTATETPMDSSKASCSAPLTSMG